MGLQHLEHLYSLEKLDLSGTAITDDGLKHVAELDSLRILRLGRTSVTDEGLEALKGMGELVNLYLDDNVTDEAVKRLKSSLPKLYVYK